MPAIITIPPHYWSGETQIEFLLTDSAGRMYPAELSGSSGFVGGRHIVTVDDTGASFTLPTNDEMPSAPGDGSNPSTWTIRVQQDRYQAFYRVSISSLNPPTNWNELIEAGTPVDPAEIWSSRLWPPDGISNVGNYGRVASDGSIEFVPPPAGTGDVSGPASSIPGNLAVFGDATGKNIVDGGPPGGGAGTTDLSNTPFAGFVRIESSTGENTDVLAATQAVSGMLSATDKATLDGTDAAGTARPPTAHAASHGAGQADEVTPAAIGADPAGSGAAAVATHEGNFVHSRIPTASQSDALNATPSLSAADRVSAISDVNTVSNDLSTHKTSGDHDARYDAAGTAATEVGNHNAAFDHTRIPTVDQKAGLDANPKLSAGDPVAAISDVSGPSTDELVGVTTNDTTPGYLQGKLQSGDNSVIFSVINPGANEILDLQATGVGGGQANVGSNVGGGVEIYKGMNGVALELRTVGPTATVVPSLNVDLLEFDVPANTFDTFGSAQNVSDDLTTHKTSGDHDSRYVQTAPSDGNHYGQRDGNWEITPVSPIGAVWTEYTWSSDTSPTSPGVGGIKVNNNDHTQATALYVHDTTNGGNNADHIWGSLQLNDYLGIWETQSDREGIYYQVTGAPIDETGWWRIPIAVVPGSLGGMENGQSVNAFTIVDPRNRNPIGGIANQVLGKLSATNHDTGWINLTAADVGAEPAFSKNTAFNKNFGSVVDTVCQGNDARLSDARTPTAHAATHAAGQADELTPAAINAATTAQGALADSALQPQATFVAGDVASAFGSNQIQTVGFASTDIARLSQNNQFTGEKIIIVNPGHPGFCYFQTAPGEKGRWETESFDGYYWFRSVDDSGTQVQPTPELRIGHGNNTDQGVVLANAVFQGHGTLNAESGLYDGNNRVYSASNPPPTGAVSSVTGANSINVSPTTGDTVVSLEGDAATPGNSKYWGTSGAGVKGFHDLPAGGGWQDGTTVGDWGEGGQSVAATGNETFDLDNGHHFYSAAAMTADKTITFQSTANHTYTYWSALLDIGNTTPTFEFSGATIRQADGYNISDGGLYWFTFAKSGTDYVVSERRIP